MAFFSRMRVLQKIMDISVVPLFYHYNTETAREVVEACARGGALVIEFTHRGDFAQDVFKELVVHLNEKYPQVILGVGSVVDEGTAALYINIGANFIVGPCLNKNIAFLCNRRKIPYIPGCATPTEISQAEELGVEICKIFPGEEAGGPSFINAIKGPMPWSNLMPSGGVENTPDSIGYWIRAGACCVGMGTKLITQELMDKGDYMGIEENVRNAISYARMAKSG